MIDEKITRYKSEINLAKKLSQMAYADKEYYENMVTRFERILRFYQDLKVLRKKPDIE
ncbi:MAG: hypothetical protein ACW98D_14510 [Promethearchaeota archaeon]